MSARELPPLVEGFNTRSVRARTGNDILYRYVRKESADAYCEYHTHSALSRLGEEKQNKRERKAEISVVSDEGEELHYRTEYSACSLCERVAELKYSVVKAEKGFIYPISYHLYLRVFIFLL